MSSSSLPISDLVKVIKYSFRECEFNEVEKILMEREKKMEIEMEHLVREHDSIKEEVLLLEKTLSLTELEKFKLEEKLQKSERKCEELKETITRLSEEQRISRDREKRAEERYDKVCKENSKMANEKNKSILELQEKINELKKKDLESQRLVAVYEEKLKCSDEKIVKMGQEMENLRREKSVADQTVEELRRKQVESGWVVEELNRQNLEATQNVEELRVKKLVSDKEAELYQSRLESLAPRIIKVEEALAKILNVKVEDLANLIDNLDKPPSVEEGAIVEFPHLKDERPNLGNGSGQDGRIDDAEDIIIMSPGVRSTCNSTGSGCIELSKKGGRNLQSSITKEDATNTVQTSPGLQSGYNPPQAESNSTDQDKGRQRVRGSGPHAVGACSDGGVPVRGQSKFEIGSSVKLPSSFAARDIIEICDSDDETTPSGVAYISAAHVDVGENEMISEKFADNPSSSKRNKRNRTECREDPLITKRKRSTGERNEDNLPIDEWENQVLESTRTGVVCESQIPLQKLNGLKDGDFSDSDDESCSDSHIEHLVAAIKSKSRRKWNFVADMVQALEKDEELCLNAVCALYRQQIRAEKSSRGSNLSKNRGFSHDDSMRRTLAEYLINRDPELRLRKSVSEVKQERPNVISQCRSLVTDYYEQLFEIYCRKEDPFFGQT